MTVGDEFILGGERVRVTEERPVTTYSMTVYDRDGNAIRKPFPLAYTAVLVEPAPPPDPEPEIDA